MIAFEFWELIYLFIFTFIKGFPLVISNMLQKNLHENKENLQMCAIVKLGWSPDYNGFEVNFKIII